MTEYISREAVNDIIEDMRSNHFILMGERVHLAFLKSKITELPAPDVQPVKLIQQIVQGRLNGANYTLLEAVKSNDTNTAYKMRGAIDICNEILADLRILTAKDGEPTRNLTDEETEIYESWIDHEAKDTGVNIMDGETE